MHSNGCVVPFFITGTPGLMIDINAILDFWKLYNTQSFYDNKPGYDSGF